MEDILDNLLTEGKRYYMSHSEFFFSKNEEENMKKLGAKIDFSKPMKISQLVCASNIENAKTAVKASIEKSGQYVVAKCRIDFLIVGD